MIICLHSLKSAWNNSYLCFIVLLARSVHAIRLPAVALSHAQVRAPAGMAGLESIDAILH